MSWTFIYNITLYYNATWYAWFEIVTWKMGDKTIPSNDESSSFKTDPAAIPQRWGLPWVGRRSGRNGMSRKWLFQSVWWWWWWWWCDDDDDDDDEAHALSASTFQNLKGTKCRLDMPIIMLINSSGHLFFFATNTLFSGQQRRAYHNISGRNMSVVHLIRVCVMCISKLWQAWGAK